MSQCTPIISGLIFSSEMTSQHDTEARPSPVVPVDCCLGFIIIKQAISRVMATVGGMKHMTHQLSSCVPRVFKHFGKAIK